MVEVEYREAVVEVLKVLEYLDDNLKKKIPNRVMEFFQKNKSITYNPVINYEDDINNIKIRDTTKQILAGLYLDYIASEEEREEYILIVRQNEKNYQIQLSKKYNTEDIFKNRKISNNTQTKEIAIIKKDSLFMRIIKKIKEVFR